MTPGDQDLENILSDHDEYNKRIKVPWLIRWPQSKPLGTFVLAAVLFLLALMVTLLLLLHQHSASWQSPQALTSIEPKLFECSRSDETSIFDVHTVLISESNGLNSSLLRFEASPDKFNLISEQNFTTSQGIIIGLGYDLAEKCLFLALRENRAENSKIFKECNGSQMELMLQVPGTIEDLAVDWRGKNLYWTNSASKKIGVTNYNGSIIGSISLDEYLEAPRAIDVDPIEGFIFWSDWGSKPHIGRCDLSGHQAQVVFLSKSAWPNALVLDQNSRSVFWIDARTDELRSMDYDGNHLGTIEARAGHQAIKHPFVVDLVGPKSGVAVLWNDWRADGLLSAKLNQQRTAINESQFVYRARKGHTLYGLTVISEENQPKLNNSDCHFCKSDEICVYNNDGGSGSGSVKHSCLNFNLVCMEDAFKCKSENLCVPRPWICDGEVDCTVDGSDEENCSEIVIHCNENEWMCKNGSQCIWETWRCDGTQDCSDDSDEINCDMIQ